VKSHTEGEMALRDSEGTEKIIAFFALKHVETTAEVFMATSNYL